MKQDRVECVLVKIDCVKNDPVDIRCGGPQYLGFDFYISKKDAVEMLEFIKKSLKENNVPVIDIDIMDETELAAGYVWTKEKIEKCIKENAKEYINESKKSHNTPKRR